MRTESYFQGYLATSIRLDKGGPSCNPPNKVCGNICIPPHYECRLTKEGEEHQNSHPYKVSAAIASELLRGNDELVIDHFEKSDPYYLDATVEAMEALKQIDAKTYLSWVPKEQLSRTRPIAGTDIPPQVQELGDRAVKAAKANDPRWRQHALRASMANSTLIPPDRWRKIKRAGRIKVAAQLVAIGGAGLYVHYLLTKKEKGDKKP